ncbi:MAG: bacteriocin-protection protein, YdeI/OmpD-associated family [Ignavibacteriae bacterium]|nr:MAG: bacteriocin-protection protein, YdeI/OmpD-associated family [Ignavibacteriota bacterium]
MSKDTEKNIVAFTSSEKWEQWLEKNHDKIQGIWLQFFKKDSGVLSLSYKDALDVALGYGWIDGQLKPCDDKSWLRKFTPRRARSLWSKRNIEHAMRLKRAGRMKPAGLKEVEAAKADGRWKKAYDSSATMELPEDFMERLSKSKKAMTFFKTLNRTNTYTIVWRLQTALNPETREKRMNAILTALEKGRKFHG